MDRRSSSFLFLEVPAVAVSLLASGLAMPAVGGKPSGEYCVELSAYVRGGGAAGAGGCCRCFKLEADGTRFGEYEERREEEVAKTWEWARGWKGRGEEAGEGEGIKVLMGGRLVVRRRLGGGSR